MGGEFGLCYGFGGGNGCFFPELTGGAVPVFPECLDEMCFTGITAFQSGFDNTVSILDHIIRQLQPETDQILMIRNAGNRPEICLKSAFSHLKLFCIYADGAGKYVSPGRNFTGNRFRNIQFARSRISKPSSVSRSLKRRGRSWGLTLVLWRMRYRFPSKPSKIMPWPPSSS